jgi:hypothetical protein
MGWFHVGFCALDFGAGSREFSVIICESVDDQCVDEEVEMN